MVTVDDKLIIIIFVRKMIIMKETLEDQALFLINYSRVSTIVCFNR